MSEPNEAAPVAAPAAPQPETQAPAPETAPQSSAPADSAKTSSKTSSKPDSTFIKSALSALRGDKAEASSEPEPKAEAEVKQSSPESEVKAASKDTKTTSAVSDDEEARAEADIKRETANMSASHRAAFTKLRYEARDLKRQLKSALEAKDSAVTGEQKAEANVELDRLRAEYDSMKSRMADLEKEAYVGRLELSEKFRAEVEQPRNNVATAVSEIAKRYADLDPDSVVLAVRSGDPDRVSRVTADMSEFDRYKFYSLVDQFQQISRVEESMRANARETLEQTARQQREQEEARQAKVKTDWESAVPSAWSKLEEDFPVLAPVDGDEDWNSKLDVLRGFARPGRFEALTVKEQAETLYRAAAFPVLVSELETAVEELKAAQQKLAKFDSATPEVQNEASTTESHASKAGNFMDGALAALRRAGTR